MANQGKRASLGRRRVWPRAADRLRESQSDRTPVHDVRIAGRNTQGVRILRTDEAEKVVSVERVPEETAGENAEGAGTDGGGADGGGALDGGAEPGGPPTV